GQASWHLPHSVQEKVSSRSFQVKSVAFSAPYLLPAANSSRGWVFGLSSAPKKQFGMAVRICICLEIGRKSRKANRTPAWSHQKNISQGTIPHLPHPAPQPKKPETSMDTGIQPASRSAQRAISAPW